MEAQSAAADYGEAPVERIKMVQAPFMERWLQAETGVFIGITEFGLHPLGSGCLSS